MTYVRKHSKTILHALATMLLFATTAPAQIVGLCNTGQTRVTDAGCTGVPVSPNLNQFGTPLLDGNWEMGFPYPNTLTTGNSSCPSVLPGGGVPTGVIISGQLASGNATYWIYLEAQDETSSMIYLGWKASCTEEWR
jgi:hypothetical protein